MAESSREEIAKLEALYANNPEGRVFTHLAEAYRKVGELDRARTILEHGLAKHPAYASAHVVLGRVLSDQQNTEEAAQEFRSVLDLDPHNHVALRCLGDIARAAGRRDEALRYFGELKHLDPSNEEISHIIDDLTAAPAVASMEESQPAPAAQAPIGEPEVAAEPEAAPEPEPEPVVEPAAHAEAEAAEPFSPAAEHEQPAAEEAETDLGKDLEFDWIPSEEEPESGLPGDLGELAAYGFDSKAHELPGFDMPDDVGSISDVDLAFSEAAPGETAEPEAFALEDSSQQPSVAEAQKPEQPAGEVLTETIAELYRAQGLYDRSAEVYRALIAQRPHEVALREKLREVEQLAGAATASAPGAEPWAAAPASPPEPMAPAAPPFEPAAPAESRQFGMAEQQPAAKEAHLAAEASGVPDVEAEAWIVGAASTADSAPTPYAWAEQPQSGEQDTAPPIGSYFQRLLAWKPKARQAAPAPAAPAAAQHDLATPRGSASQIAAPAPMTQIEPEPTPMPVREEEVVEVEELFATPEPADAGVDEPFDLWLDQEAAAVRDPWAAAPPAPAPAVQPAPEPEPEPAPPAPAAAPAPSRASEMPPASAPTSRPHDAGSAFEEWFGAGEPETAEPESAATSEDASANADEDDDLEMFRSWLQSLKK